MNDGDVCGPGADQIRVDHSAVSVTVPLLIELLTQCHDVRSGVIDVHDIDDCSDRQSVDVDCLVCHGSQFSVSSGT